MGYMGYGLFIDVSSWSRLIQPEEHYEISYVKIYLKIKKITAENVCLFEPQSYVLYNGKTYENLHEPSSNYLYTSCKIAFGKSKSSSRSLEKTFFSILVYSLIYTDIFAFKFL